MRARAPKTVPIPARVGSTYLLSGLVKCKACNRALSGQDAKSGQFAYYVCQSIMKRGKDACETPRLPERPPLRDRWWSTTWMRGNRHEKLRYSWAVDLDTNG